MEEEIDEILKALMVARTLIRNLDSNCPDIAEGKLVAKASKAIDRSFEFMVKAKHYKSDKLSFRGS